MKESVELPSASAFRLLQWNGCIDDVFWVVAPGDLRPVKGEGTHWHYHRALELTVFTAGWGIWFVGDRIQRFEAGSVVFVGSNLPHYWHVTGKSAGYSLQFEIPPSHPIWGFAESQPLVPFLDATLKGIAYRGARNSEIIALLGELAVSDGLLRVSLLLQLFALLSTADESERESLSSKTFWLPEASEQQNAMRAAMHFILTHYRGRIMLQDLLRVTGMSRPTFCRCFKTHTGKSLNQVLQEIRIEAACKALVETRKSVTEIAYDCGFSQISFFNRTFQKVLQCAPTDYRRRHAAGTCKVQVVEL